MRNRAHHLIAAGVLLLPFLAVGCGGGGGEASGGTTTGGQAAKPAAGIFSPDPATVGKISGSVGYENGASPKRINMSADPYCDQQHPGGAVTETISENDNGTLQWVFVYIKSGLPDAKFAVPSEPVVLNQHGCQYSPHVFGVQTDQPLQIVNSDSTLHNVHARPKKNPEFNMAQPMQGMKSSQSFPNPEIMVPVKCDVHPWMASYIGVLAHPYFAVTGEDGSFEIDDVPPGTYTVEAWHEKLGTKTMEVTVEPKGEATAEFSYTG